MILTVDTNGVNIIENRCA